MSSVLQKTEGSHGYTLKNFICSNRQTPPENMELERDFKKFLEQGITQMIRQGLNYDLIEKPNLIFKITQSL